MAHQLIKSIAVAGLAAACLSAHAGNSLVFSNFANGYKTVDIALSSPNTAITESAAAGGLLASLNGGPSFTAFCIDLYQNVSFNTTYTDYTPAAGSAHAFANSHAATDLGKLFSEGNVLSTSVAEAAFQIAVWEIAYETTGIYNLASGSARFTGGTADSDGALSLASTWLSNLAGTRSSYTISVLESPTHQDMVIAAPVPEPSTCALLAGGLMAIGFVARRRRAA